MNLSAVLPDSRISDPLVRALAEVVQAAAAGATPVECAVVYRSLAREFPDARALLDGYARLFDRMGDRWYALTAP